MRLDPGQIEMVDDAMVEVLRRKTTAQRLQIAFDMWQYARDRLEAAVRWRHPEWDDQAVGREVSRRLLHEPE